MNWSHCQAKAERMNRFQVILQLGVDDTYDVKPAEPMDVVCRVPMLDAIGYLDFGFYEFVDRVRRIALRPSELAFDLVLLATAVSGADNRVSRALHAQDGWTREIHLHVPVSNPDAWNAQRAVILRALNFLSGDRWNITFRPRPAKHAALVPSVDELNLGSHTTVSLLSGGLDSCIGAINLLEQKERPIFVSHSSSSSGGYQKAVVRKLGEKYGDKAFIRIRAWNAFPRHIISGGGDEDTTRTRSFLFFALAVYVANGFGRPMSVLVPENGFIALNVPLDPLRLGALSTRTAHPYYLARWNEFMRGLGLDVTLSNPYATITKGRMVANCANRDVLKQVAPITMSCASPGKARFKKQKPGHCGYCLPCLIRRASLLKGLGAGEDTTHYNVPMDGATLNSMHAEGEHIRAFQFASARLRANPNLAKFAIYKPGPLSDVGEQIDSYIAVYRDGMAEIDELLANTRTRPE